MFLCGLFIPVQQLPIFLQPLSYFLPLTYGADILRSAINSNGLISLGVSFMALAGFSLLLFFFSLRNIQKKWIY